MSTQKIDAVEYILGNIPRELFRNPNRMNQRKIIRIIIDSYTKYIFNKLINYHSFILRGIGTLVPTDLKIGAKFNQFTGNPVAPVTIKRIRFIPSDKIKNELRK